MSRTIEEQRARCNAYYAANRDAIQQRQRMTRLRARIAQLERAVRLGLPIGRTIPACGTSLAAVWHRSRGEQCGQCAFLIASEVLARTWVAPRHAATSAEARKARQLARQAAWNLANAERVRAYKRAHYERVGREAWNAKGAAWREANPDRARALVQARKRADRDRGAADSALRRARVRGLPSEPIDRNAVWVRDGGICHLCASAADPKAWHLDHVVPIARGGAHVYSNVRVSHPACNQSKGARVPSAS